MAKTTSKMIAEAKRIVKDTVYTCKVMYPNISTEGLLYEAALHIAKENIRLKELIK